MSYRVFVCLLKNRVEIKTMIEYTVNVCAINMQNALW